MGASNIRCTEPLGTALQISAALALNRSVSPGLLFSNAFLLIFLGLSD